MMQDHPLPQDITGYQFHIVGNMTLKQFAEVGAGCFVGFLIYTTNLVDVVKWPLIGLAVATGAAAAFVPFEEQPFDHWIVTFFRVIYNPTKFFWRREPKIPEIFQYQPTNLKPVEAEFDLSPARRQRIKEFMTSIQQPLPDDAFDQYEQQRIDYLLQTFKSVKVSQLNVERGVIKPNLTIRARDLKAKKRLNTHAESSQTSLDQGVSQKAVDPSQIAADINIPYIQAVKLPKAQEQAEDQKGLLNNELQESRNYVQNQQTNQPLNSSSTQNATYNQDLPFPSLPTNPNKPVGMVLGPNNEILANAIIEIKNQGGAVVRAIKTNTLGQFFVTTPLSRGKYSLSAEKDGYVFQDQQLEIQDEVVQPIEIRGIITPSS